MKQPKQKIIRCDKPLCWRIATWHIIDKGSVFCAKHMPVEERTRKLDNDYPASVYVKTGFKPVY